MSPGRGHLAFGAQDCGKGSGANCLWSSPRLAATPHPHRHTVSLPGAPQTPADPYLGSARLNALTLTAASREPSQCSGAHTVWVESDRLIYQR